MSLKSAHIRLCAAIVAIILCAVPASAQILPRGPRTLVRAGLMDRPDSLKAERDSLRMMTLADEFDSLAMADYRIDSVVLRSLRTDDITTLDSVALVHFETGFDPADTVKRRLLKKGWFMNDSMSL